MLDRADYEELLREDPRPRQCPICLGENTSRVGHGSYFCDDCQHGFTSAQLVLAEDETIPF